MPKQNNEINIEPLRLAAAPRSTNLYFLSITRTLHSDEIAVQVYLVCIIFTADCLTSQNGGKIIERTSFEQNFMNFKCRQQRHAINQSLSVYTSLTHFVEFTVC